MTWVGIVLSIFVFVFLLKFYCKRYKLNFWKVFSWLPVFIILPYILGSYMYYLLHHWLIVPVSINDILAVIIPNISGSYDFHFIGIWLGFFIAVYMFVNSVNIYIEKFKWIDVLFYSLTLSLVPLGFFLLLGQSFYWLSTTSSLGVSVISSNSAMLGRWSQFYPVGIFLSLVSLINFLVVFIVYYIFKKKYGFGFLGFILLLLSLNIVFVFQSYPRYAVINYGGYIYDIKNYFTVFLAILTGVSWFKFIKEKKIWE